jgi:hypothetical protein
MRLFGHDRDIINQGGDKAPRVLTIPEVTSARTRDAIPVIFSLIEAEPGQGVSGFLGSAWVLLQGGAGPGQPKNATNVREIASLHQLGHFPITTRGLQGVVS